MSAILRLSELLARGDEALAATSILLAQKLFRLDAANVEAISAAQLDALLGALPLEWGINDLAEVIDLATLRPAVSAQVTEWLRRRRGDAELATAPGEPEAPATVRIASTALHPIRALDRVIEEYRDYLRTEFRARDPRLKQALEQALDAPRFLAQEAFYQAHRPFKPGKGWRELPLDSRLASVMERRAGSHAYLHQSEAIEHLLGANAGPLVVTTGTGSGKTETFLLPVIQNAINDAIRYNRPGLTAILIYPMNALANDQLERINAYLNDSGFAGAVAVRQYDRGTSQQERQELRRNPPHILLTNYMMLEYLLVRPADRDDIFANHRCRFLVLDEVHTYRGTLGSNIALLVRRLAAHLRRARQDWLPTPPPAERPYRYPALIPIGTSATIKSLAEGDLSVEERLSQRDRAVQEFFSTLTGAPPETIRVIGETLGEAPDVRFRVSGDHRQGFILQIEQATPPACWHIPPSILPPDVWETVAPHLTPDTWNLIPILNRMLVGAPLPVSQIVTRIRAMMPERTSFAEADLAAQVEAALTIGAALPDDIPGALRLRAHRFIRGGWQFHRCLNPDCGKLYPMGEGQCHACGFRTAPLYLCRSCGADYLRFTGEDPHDPTSGILTPSATSNEQAEWLLYEHQRFDLAASDVELEENGDAGESVSRRGTPKVASQMRGRPVERGSFDPQSCRFSRDEREFSLPVTLAPARTQCLCCGATLGSRNVLTPIALGTSAAIKVMAEGLASALAEAHRGQANHDGKERLLVFSDSRQDAAHQARFITFAGRYDRMRRRVMQILDRRGALSIQGIVEELRAQAVAERDNPYTEELRSSYVPPETLQRIQAWEEAPLLDELALNAGYRATLINLGLLRVAYYDLEAQIERQGAPLAQALQITPQQLGYLCRCMLDEIRARGCLARDLLRYHPLHPSCPDALRMADWERRVKLPQGYPLDPAGRPLTYLDRAAIPTGIRVHNAWRKAGAGGRGPSLERLLTHLLKRFGGVSATEQYMADLLAFLLDTHYLTPSELYGARAKARLLQINAEMVYLHPTTAADRKRCEICGLSLAGAYAGAPCPRCHGSAVPWPDAEVEVNRTVKRIRAPEIVPLVAREHTAQVPPDDRKVIEEQFKAGNETAKVNLLACSPTLEMGIDVGGLDAVILRNVPPRPDNYAQRAGRAGRRTRVGLVLGYARNTPHDQYFYDKPAEMIAGEVPAPSVALGNRDVILRHLAAIAFGAAEPGLAGKMVEYITPQGQPKQEAVDALIAGVRAQTAHALALAQSAWGQDVLPSAGLTEADLQAHLDALPQRIQDVIDRTARQVQELRQALDTFAAELQGKRAGTRAAELIARLLGISESKQNGAEADDRSAGYPLRRFAEFGILPGYEFPSEPAALRLLNDPREEDPITVGRRFGIGQFQPEAQVYARARRWKVIGLDTASPWNPRSEEPSWTYRLCTACGLRHDADEPRCPRCQTSTPGRPIPAFSYAGFVAIRDEGPILDEEERFAARSRVTGQPQWDGQISGRWSTAPGWLLEWRRGETVRWLNEGPAPNAAAREAAVLLHQDAAGYRLCPSCGRILNLVNAKPKGKGGTPRAQQGGTDPYGHAENCPHRGTGLPPVAIVTSDHAETLRLLVTLPANMRPEEVIGWGVSLGYALRTGMRNRYMLDGPEIEFELEGPWPVNDSGMRYQRASLTFIDPSVGGSGYLPRIAAELHLVAQQAIAHLDHPNCETACYRCLKSYQNQRYHDALNWPRIMPDLHALASEPVQSQPLNARDLDDPRPWLEAYAAGVGSPLELKFLRLFEQHGFHPQKQVPVAPSETSRPISLADFALPEQRVAIYIDGAAFHEGTNLRRDRAIREQLRHGDPPWRVIELQAHDLRRGAELVRQIRAMTEGS